jgi:signal transduction histidine kinase
VDCFLTLRARTQHLQSSIPKNVRLELDLSDDIPFVDADPRLIQQLIINLVTNGTQAIGEHKGTVRVKTEVEAIAGDVIKGDFSVGDTRPGRYVCLEVRDSGAAWIRVRLLTFSIRSSAPNSPAAA